MRVLDLCAGELGWSKIFAARGHQCICVDLKEPKEIPQGCIFHKHNILSLRVGTHGFWFETLDGGIDFTVDFIVASTPCEEFSVHGMKHFFPHPKYPELGIKLFNHTRQLCEASGVPYVMENVRAAQQFVGNAVHHCGPWFLWGNAVPPLIHKNILKGRTVCRAMPPNLYAKIKNDPDRIAKRKAYLGDLYSPSKAKTARAATIPPELANCVCVYAERLLEQRAEQRPLHREAAK